MVHAVQYGVTCGRVYFGYTIVRINFSYYRAIRSARTTNILFRVLTIVDHVDFLGTLLYLVDRGELYLAIRFSFSKTLLSQQDKITP